MAAANAVLDPNTASAGETNPLALAQQRLAALPMQKKMGLAGGLAMAIALLVGLTLWSNSPNYEVLF